jgi:hypothetical protein
VVLLKDCCWNEGEGYEAVDGEVGEKPYGWLTVLFLFRPVSA